MTKEKVYDLHERLVDYAIRSESDSLLGNWKFLVGRWILNVPLDIGR